LVQPADIQDRDAGLDLLVGADREFPRLELLTASGYRVLVPYLRGHGHDKRHAEEPKRVQLVGGRTSATC